MPPTPPKRPGGPTPQQLAKATGQLRPKPKPTVTAPKQRVLTPREQAAMDSIGYRPGQPIPENMADIFAEARELVSAPAPAAPPPLHGAEDIQLRMQQALERERLERETAEKDKRMPPAVRQAAQFARETAPKSVEPFGEIEIDPEEPDPVEGETAVETPAATPAGDTGAATPSPFCPHCGMDQRQPAGPEPPHQEKMAFIQALLGDLCYKREMVLFGGALRVTFRSLTTPEIDAIFQQVGREIDTQKTQRDDLWERTQRLRMVLQLARWQHGTTDYAFPDGLSRDTNRYAQRVWHEELRDGEGKPLAPEEMFAAIEQDVSSRFLHSESAFRAVNKECMAFNRGVAHMENMVANSDFWKQTDSPA